MGIDSAATPPDADASDSSKEVVITGHPTIGAYASSLQDTPQNVTVIPQEVLNEQAVNNLQDALKNVPGITLNAGEGGTHGDNINLRGFAASDDFFLDGLRDTGFYTRDSFNYEGIEVYKGPASTLFGRGSTGGVVNQVSKTPQLDDFVRGTAVVGTNSEKRGTADINYAFDDSIAARLNVMGLKSLVADRDFVENRRWGVGSLGGVRARYAHDANGELSAPRAERYSRLRHPVRVRPTCAGAAGYLLWLAVRRSNASASGCGHGHLQNRIQR